MSRALISKFIGAGFRNHLWMPNITTAVYERTKVPIPCRYYEPVNHVETEKSNVES